jgi:predicted nucleotide-binding protein
MESIVDAFHSHLEDIAEVIPWKFGVFKSGESALESLVNALGRFDFAAFILGPDDLVESRGGKNASPRDNVVFELGCLSAGSGVTGCLSFTTGHRHQNSDRPAWHQDNPI